MVWDYKAFSFWCFSKFTKFSRYHFILWPLLFKHKIWAIKCLNTYFAFIISTSTTEKHPASPIPRFLILTPHLPENKFVGYTLHRLKEANLTSGISTPLFWNPVSALVWTTTLFRLKGRAALLGWKGRSIMSILWSNRKGHSSENQYFFLSSLSYTVTSTKKDKS